MRELLDKRHEEQPASPAVDLESTQPSRVPPVSTRQVDNVLLGLDALKQTWREYKDLQQH